MDGDHYLLSVRDNGPGIAPEALPRLYQPFYTTRAQGMGLGLALCETLAGAMDARIEARNLTPAGACFTAPAARRSPPMTTSPPAHAHAQSPLVYLVDDDDAVRDALALLLRSVGLRSVGHGDPVAFLDSLPPQAIGCVVLDIRMPGIGGLDVLSRLAEQSDLPVIMLTGHANVDLCRRAFKGGAIEFLQNRWTTMCSWTRCRPPCARTSPAANDCR